MKPILPILAIIGLLQSCTAPVNFSSQVIGNPANCPRQTEPIPIASAKDEGLYQQFDYHIRDILTDADTITFQTQQYNIVFCRFDRTWTVEPGTLASERQRSDNPEQFQENLQNPPYQTIELNGKSYQYRVILEPKPFGNDEPKTVVFELITPNSKQPQRHPLYTLEQVREAEVGIALGVPRITSAVNYADRLFWSVASEQGEGFSGIATIVGYNPDMNEVAVIQPQEIQGQQITDFVIAGDRNNPVFWLGTHISGEGNPYLPGTGLVAYRPSPPNLKSGTITSYTVSNSPIIGAIPDKLHLEGDLLWVGTGNGVCQVRWQGVDNPGNWSCWRFAAMAKLPSQELPLYSRLLEETPAVTLEADRVGDTVEVLWWSPVDYQTQKGRYEVRYEDGFTVTLEEGASSWSEIYGSSWQPLPGQPPLHWAGHEWYWNGDRFVRGFDQVALNFFGGGPLGIVSDSDQWTGEKPANMNALRGDLEVLELTETTTKLNYYSGWVEEELLNPYFTVVPQNRPFNSRPNPLNEIGFGNQTPK
ncbi:hypothetical protein [Coleofasciculus sp.]|uniref:hypothetical protein n=1 Tax=Coleofasciculus sp. TaxID=3100458 RepID=UPI0039FB57D9